MMADSRLISFLVYTVLVVPFLNASPVSNNQCRSSSLSASINAAGSQLVKQLKKHDNYFISPMSIHTALAMTYLGTSGRTADEMEAAFQLRKLGLQGNSLHESFAELLDVYNAQNDQYSLSVANGLFVQQNYPINEKYMNGLKSYYKAAVKSLDFVKEGEAAKNEINRWVSEKTKSKISELLSSPLDPSTRLALLNAVYFKGTWKVQFDKEETYDELFFIDEKARQRVKFMHMHKQNFSYYEDPDSEYKFLEMPYKGEDVVMLLALPKFGEFSPEMEMTSAELCRITKQLRETELDSVMIPKFRLEFTKELKEPLQGLGIERLFTGEADLTEISDGEKLSVSSVLHKAVIDVNEEGSEAAAVTGVIIENRMGNMDKPEFKAYRPFLFYIVDKRNGVVLFSGRLSDPS